MVLQLYKISYPDESFVEEIENNTIEKLRPLKSHFKAMDLFTSAIQIEDNSLKFFSFYKVLEHVAPIALNMEANELMCKKLNEPRHCQNGGYIRSVFSLASAFNVKSHSDEDLMKTAFDSCFDFVGLFDNLPNSIKTKIRKNIKLNKNDEFTYSLPGEKLSVAKNMAAKIIYKTRNMIVHSKSNFNSNGEECSEVDMSELNIFMK